MLNRQNSFQGETVCSLFINAGQRGLYMLCVDFNYKSFSFYCWINCLYSPLTADSDIKPWREKKSCATDKIFFRCHWKEKKAKQWIELPSFLLDKRPEALDSAFWPTLLPSNLYVTIKCSVHWTNASLHFQFNPISIKVYQVTAADIQIQQLWAC